MGWESNYKEKYYLNFELPWEHFGLTMPESPTMTYQELIDRSTKTATEYIEKLKKSTGVSYNSIEKELNDIKAMTPERYFHWQMTRTFMKILLRSYTIVPDKE